jgi:hypothetical protein
LNFSKFPHWSGRIGDRAIAAFELGGKIAWVHHLMPGFALNAKEYVKSSKFAS